MAFEEHAYDRLEELGDSNFEIVKGEPNIKGWNVKTADGLMIGEIHDLLFDRMSRKVRYLIISMDNNELHLAENRKVLVPIGIAELYSKRDYEKSVIQVSRDNRSTRDVYDPADDGNVVILPGVTIAQLNALPLYEKDHLSPDIETAILNIFDVSSPNRAHNKNKIREHEYFDEDRFYKRTHRKEASGNHRRH